MNKVIVGVGSNMEAKKHINQAKKRLQHDFGFLKSSTFLETDPIGFESQDKFQNGAFLLETEQEQELLKQHLRKIEADLGRVRGPNKNCSRTIDLDILVWNDEIVDSDVYDRYFLKDSILELCPNLKNLFANG